MVVLAARPLVEEIAILVPQILTQMLVTTVETPSHRPQNAQFLCPERRCRRSCSRTTTKRKPECCDDRQGTEDTGAPLHVECVIAVPEELNLHLILLRDVTDDSQHVTLHVPLTAEDSIDQEQLMKMPKRATQTNAAPREGARDERCSRFSAREQTSVTSPMWA